MDNGEAIFVMARQAGLLFNEDKGNEKANAIHKERILKFAVLLTQRLLEDLSQGGA